MEFQLASDLAKNNDDLLILDIYFFEYFNFLKRE